MATDRKKENQRQPDRQNVGDRMQPENPAALLRQRMTPAGLEQQQMVQALRNRLMNADAWQNSPEARALIHPPDGQQMPGGSGEKPAENALEVLHKDRIGPAEVAEAQTILDKYRAGKAALENRIIENDRWFKLRHWKDTKNYMMQGKPQPSSAWLFNSIANKHADAMDNYPEPNVLPRAADDEQTAKELSSILPVILEQSDYEQVWSDSWWRKLKQGTGVKGIFWDSGARGGVGDIAVRCMDILRLYWEPGVSDIQDSPNFFSLSIESTEQLLETTAPAAAATFETTVGASASEYAPIALYDVAASASAEAVIAESGSVQVAISVPGVADGTQVVAICWDRNGNSRTVPVRVVNGVVYLTVYSSGPVMIMARTQVQG